MDLFALAPICGKCSVLLADLLAIGEDGAGNQEAMGLATELRKKLKGLLRGW